MAELREYHVTVNGHNTIMNLSAADAARLEGTPVEPDDVTEKRRTVPNKARAASLKDSATN